MDQTAQIISDLKAKIEKTIKHVKDQLGGIRTGRASPMLVDTIRVDYYGAMTPLHGMAHISVPDARQLLIKPFDVSAMKEIERAILKSDLGLSPQSDGKVLRLIMPPLSTEQRQKLAVKVKDLVEQNRVALRNERRDANKHGEQAKRFFVDRRSGQKAARKGGSGDQGRRRQARRSAEAEDQGDHGRLRCERFPQDFPKLLLHMLPACC